MFENPYVGILIMKNKIENEMGNNNYNSKDEGMENKITNNNIITKKLELTKKYFQIRESPALLNIPYIHLFGAHDIDFPIEYYKIL